MTQPHQYTADDSDKVHAYADTDSSPSALHHTVGTGPTNAAPGNHQHNGRDSKQLKLGTVTGSRGGNAALANLLSVLNAAGVIVDATVA